jgi:hypothetical protein
MSNEKTFTFSELEQIIRNRMYTMENGRQPNEGGNRVLEKELERQNLLIKTHENILDRNLDPLPDSLTSNMYQLRDQIEDAIALLKTQNNGN